MFTIRKLTPIFSLFFLVALITGCGGSSNDNQNTNNTPDSELNKSQTATRSPLDNIWKLDPNDSDLNRASSFGIDPALLLNLSLLAVENPTTQKAELFFCETGTSIAELEKKGTTYTVVAPTAYTNLGLKIREITAGSRYELRIPTTFLIVGLDLIPHSAPSPSTPFVLNVSSSSKINAIVPAKTNFLCGFASKPSANSAALQVNLAGALDSSIAWIRLLYPQGLKNTVDFATKQASLNIASSEFTSAIGSNNLSAKQGSVQITQCDNNQIRFVVDITTMENAHITGEWLWQHEGKVSCPATVANKSSATNISSTNNTSARTLQIADNAPVINTSIAIQSDSQRWNLSEWSAAQFIQQNRSNNMPLNQSAQHLLISLNTDTPVIACFADHQEILTSEHRLTSLSSSLIAWQPDPLVESTSLYQIDNTTQPLLIQNGSEPLQSQAWCSEHSNNQAVIRTIWQQQPLTITLIGTGKIVGDHLTVTIDSPALQPQFGIDHWTVPNGWITNSKLVDGVGELHLQLPDQQWLIVHE